MRERRQTTGAFFIGVALIVASLVMGKAVLVPIIVFPASNAWRIGAFVAYGVSWVVMLAGIALAGREGYRITVEAYRDYRRRALGHVARGGRKAAQGAATALKRPVESGRRTARRTADLVNKPLRARKAARLRKRRKRKRRRG